MGWEKWCLVRREKDSAAALCLGALPGALVASLFSKMCSPSQKAREGRCVEVFLLRCTQGHCVRATCHHFSRLSCLSPLVLCIPSVNEEVELLGILGHDVGC